MDYQNIFTTEEKSPLNQCKYLQTDTKKNHLKKLTIMSIISLYDFCPDDCFKISSFLFL